MAKRTTTKKVAKAKKVVKKASSAKAKSSTSKAKNAGKKTVAKKAKRVTTKASKRAAATKTVAKKKAVTKKVKSAGAKAKKTKAVAKKVPLTSRKLQAATSATSQDPIQFPQDRPIPKTHLTAKELREFKELLLAKRAELAGDVQRLSSEALSNGARGQGEQSAMPIHMADVGSDNWEQEFTLGLLANEEALIREIDNALERIQKKSYGVCLATGKKISHARLRAKPWAQYCIEYARAREEGRAI